MEVMRDKMPRTDHATWESVPLIVAGVIPASQVGITEPIYVGAAEKVTFFVKADQDTKIYVLTGITADDCVHALKAGTGVDTEDTDREWDCNDEAISFQITEYTPYISLVVVNEDASNSVEVTASIA